MLWDRKTLRSLFCGENNEFGDLLDKSVKVRSWGDRFVGLGLSSVADGPAVEVGYLVEMYIRRKAEGERTDDSAVTGNLFDWDIFMQLSDHELDDWVIENHPFRSNDDIKLRNIRFTDLRDVIISTGRERLLRKCIVYTVDIDYIFLLNFCLYLCLVDETCANLFVETTLLSLGTWGAVDVLKDMSDYIKLHVKPVGVKWWCLVELNCLAGYRNPPVAGFSIQAEAEKLAHGGKVHNFPYSFKDYCRFLLNTKPKDDFVGMTLREFVESGLWATSGSSSEGKISIVDKVSGKVKVIKCRKNFVMDSLSVDDVVKLALNCTEQVNKTLLKCELGKIRLAVASDLGTYIAASYLVYHTGSFYLNWPGVTLEESSMERAKRMCLIRDKLKTQIGLPFDFKSFDNQPTTEEIKAIVSVIVERARPNCRDSESIVDTLCYNVVNNFDSSWLLTMVDHNDPTKIGSSELKYKVEGGLMSGHRYTSIVGNGFNSVVTSMVIDCCEALGFNRSDFSFYVQGDDTLILCHSKKQALVCVRLFQVFGIEFGSGKFSVQVGAGEYLRVWMTPFQAVGYGARTLPNLVQRKPWSNTPWDKVGVIRGIWDKIGILTRRGFNSNQLARCWTSLATRWCRLHNVPAASLSVPTAIGGFGVGIWDGELVVKASKVWDQNRERNSLYTVERRTDYRRNNIKTRLQEMGLNPDNYDLDQAADDELNGVVGADDVPQVALIMRREWDNYLHSVRWSIRPSTLGKAVSFSIPAWYSDVYTLVHDQRFISFESFVASIAYYSNLYGKYTQAVSALQTIEQMELYRISGEKIDKWGYMKEQFPAFYHDKIRLCRRGHVGEVLDYLGGNINLNENLINNDVIEIYTRFCLVWLHTLHRDLDILKVYFKYRSLMLASFTTNPVYRYCFSQV